MGRSAVLGQLLQTTSLTILLSGHPAVAQVAPALCPAQLGDRLEAIAAEQLSDQARWGVLVQPLGTSSPLYAHDAQQYFTPASNAKLFTSAAALAHLGPDFRIATTVYTDALEPALGPVDLKLVGRGDPSFDSDDLQQLAQQVSQAGVTQVNQIIADERYLGDRFINPTWDWEDVQSGYGAPVNSLILDQNAIGVRLFPQAVGQPLRLEWEQPQLAAQWRVVNQSMTVAAPQPEFVQVGRNWSAPVLRIRGQLREGAPLDRSAVAVTDPKAYFLQRFEAALNQEGVIVLQPLRVTEDQPELDDLSTRRAIATVTSPPLSELLSEVNAHSRNLYAEALLRHLGRQDAPILAGDDLLAAGLNQLEAILTPLGVTGAYQLADGSGLSRRSLVTPQALVQTLQAMASHPHAAIYRNSLAIAGEQGTLRSRFRGTPVAGRFWGKSGGLTGVSSLSGYLYPPDYEPLALSLLIDHSDQSGTARRQAIDAMVTAIARLTTCRD